MTDTTEAVMSDIDGLIAGIHARAKASTERLAAERAEVAELEQRKAALPGEIAALIIDGEAKAAALIEAAERQAAGIVAEAEAEAGKVRAEADATRADIKRRRDAEAALDERVDAKRKEAERLEQQIRNARATVSGHVR